MNTVKNIIEYISTHKILKHTLFWLFLFASTFYKDLVHEFPFFEILIMHGCVLIPQILLSYFIVLYVSNFLLDKKYILATLSLLISTYIFSVIARIFTIYIGETLIREGDFKQESILEILTDIETLLFHYATALYWFVLIFLCAKFFMNYIKIKEKETIAQKEKIATELKMLKAQLNPHFLFNTLNNIYALSIENSPKTPKSIGLLADILDYVLYRCNTKFVALSKEIELLENYIELEKLRYDNRLQVFFTKDIEKDSVIAPLILLSLLENAFKHGAGEDIGKPFIDIKISNKNNVTTFVISNSVPTTKKIKDKQSIGLLNIQKQLDLIYPKNHKLSINTANNQFEVTLQIY